MPARSGLGIFLRGIAMGAADVVPGVSGGTIAFITGIYERLIKAIRDVVDSPALIIKDRSLKPVNNLDWIFIIPLALGIVSALYIGSLVIPHFIRKFPTEVFGFFAGLILASAVVIYPRSRPAKRADSIWLVTGVLVGVFASVLSTTSNTPSLTFLALSGFLAISAMVLPGISGSYILLILGVYEHMLDSIHALPDTWLTLGVFALGAIVGLAALSNLLAYLLKQHRKNTLLVLTGLMLGGLMRPLMIIVGSTNTLIGWLSAIILATIGSGMVFKLSKLAI